MPPYSRRTFNKIVAATAFAAPSLSGRLAVGEVDLPAPIEAISEDLIRTGVRMALEKTLLPAAAEKAYPGHFSVTADGSVYGSENTWPGLDSWELAGAYLLLGKRRLVLDYFDFVEASQRADGNIPFAVFPAETPPPGITTHLQGLKYPEDVFTYKPAMREGQPEHSNMTERKWIGLFIHWQPKANPLGLLGPISYLLTAAEIHTEGSSLDWLKEKIDSIDRAGRYILSQRDPNGLYGHSGFYVELPPRYRWDGITQCYTVHVYRLLAGFHRALGDTTKEREWLDHAEALAKTFRDTYWRGDHFAEYVHPEQGVVDLHGLTDVNWAAVAFDVATEEQTEKIWPLMMAEKEFWHGDMPTQLVSRPYTYREWEMPEEITFHNGAGNFKDVSAMGRVWYLEALACLKMNEWERVKESARLVCKRGEKDGWLWAERYFPIPDSRVANIGPAGYCEYAAILVRVVLGNPALFLRA